MEIRFIKYKKKNKLTFFSYLIKLILLFFEIILYL